MHGQTGDPACPADEPALRQHGALFAAAHLKGGGKGAEQVVDDTEEGKGQRDQPQQQACTWAGS